MDEYIINRYNLSQYSLLRAQLVKLDEDIRIAEDELAELNKYSMNVNSVLTGMPSGNEKRDKIAEFIIRLENDKARLDKLLTDFIAERDYIKYRLYKIRAAVNQVTNKQLREIIQWYYFDGESAIEIAKKTYMTRDAVYKKMDRFFCITQRQERARQE